MKVGPQGGCTGFDSHWPELPTKAMSAMASHQGAPSMETLSMSQEMVTLRPMDLDDDHKRWKIV